MCLSLLQSFHPTKLRGVDAYPCHDWGLLLVMLSVELSKAEGLTPLLAADGMRAVSAQLVLQRCREVPEDDPLRAFLADLNKAADW